MGLVTKPIYSSYYIQEYLEWISFSIYCDMAAAVLSCHREVDHFHGPYSIHESSKESKLEHTRKRPGNHLFLMFMHKKNDAYLERSPHIWSTLVLKSWCLNFAALQLTWEAGLDILIVTHISKHKRCKNAFANWEGGEKDSNFFLVIIID